jgi:coproporphyrinogen III oxidase-like Fe-S oxidoreductase
MEELFSYIFSNFEFNEDYCKTIELNPSSTDFQKLDIIKKY